MRQPICLGRLWIILCLALLETACGGGSGGGGEADNQAPTATIDADSGALARDRKIVIHFSEPMDVASLNLGGDIGVAASAAWSQGSSANDTLTLTPRTGTWPGGEGHQLLVDARDVAGNALPRLSASYVVPLKFGTFPSAETVIGQANFQAQDPNRGGALDANTLYNPEGTVAVSPDGKLFVPDYDNHRVLVFSSVPAGVDASAAFALGQHDLQSDNAPRSRTGFQRVGGLSIAGGRLLVTDRDSNRILVYSAIPQDASAVPDVVLGQPDFTTFGASCSASGMDRPESGILTEDGKVLVADSRNNRVLIWNQVPASPATAPDLVIGQSDGAHCNGNDDAQDGSGQISQRTVWYPTGVWSDGNRLVVADANNHRVLIWNSFPARSFQPADVVLGQQTFTANAANDSDQNGNPDGNASPRTFDYPASVTSNGVQLAVSDTGNSRVLVWNEFPKQSFQAADMVIGHSGFTQSRQNDVDENGAADPAGASARTLFFPGGVLFKGDQLFVSDAANHRVLIFRAD